MMMMTTATATTTTTITPRLLTRRRRNNCDVFFSTNSSYHSLRKTRRTTSRANTFHISVRALSFFGGGGRGGGDDDESTIAYDVRPGQGSNAPKFPEICDYLASSGKCEGISPEEFKERYYFEKKRKKVTCLDLRQPLEYEDWRVPPFASCPYQIPSKNTFRRVSGYALSIKGGLKERDEDFVRNCYELCERDLRSTVVVCDLKGGSIRNAQSSETSNRGVIDRSDSFAVRACYELVQAGFQDVKFVEGGFPGLIDDAGLPYESEKFMDLLQNQSEGNRKLLMYAKLLPDPTILPGILIQGGVFLLFGLAFYNVGGIGDYLAENVPAACSFFPIRSCMGA